ncbi:MAG: hypothetical protein DHS80DRAFT_30373 [Piptocephalis tieghemiana]|nr:MAG: hypothetical protein DHS80DRAFT_30373 [Piptocephalis tieghemiana]
MSFSNRFLISLRRSTPQPRTTIFLTRRHYVPIGSHMSDDNPESLQAGKERIMKGSGMSDIKSAPQWDETLASDSEADIKADRDVRDDGDLSSLQKDSVEYMSKKN